MFRWARVVPAEIYATRAPQPLLGKLTWGSVQARSLIQQNRSIAGSANAGAPSTSVVSCAQPLIPVLSNWLGSNSLRNNLMLGFRNRTLVAWLFVDRQN